MSFAKTADYIVIGGGIAGLSAAVHLASKGHAVHLFEKNERIGGKLNTWSSNGFNFDTGPHVLTMIFAFQELFAQAGRRLEDYVELVKLPNVCRYHFPDGLVLDCSANLDDAASAIERAFPGSRSGFNRFLEYSSDVYNKTTDTFLTQDVSAAMAAGGPLYAWRRMSDFFSLKPFESLDSRISRSFNHEKLRQIFRLYALYSGSHPKRCSAIFSTVAHVQWKLGTYYINGGMYRLAEAIKRLLDELGVIISTNSQVKRIISSNGSVNGVVVEESGLDRNYLCQGIICNQDVLTAGELFDAPTISGSLEPSTSAYLLLLGVSGNYDLLDHHNSFLTADEWGEYTSIFDKKLPFADPTIGVSCQSVTDSSRSPRGMSNLFIMANVPAIGNEFRWDNAASQAYREVILTKLERMGLTDLRRRIVTEQTWTPEDLGKRYGAARGAIYGLSSNGFRQAFLRPGQKAKNLSGLYFAGGSTHPGGGLPLCVLSGRIAAEQLLKR